MVEEWFEQGRLLNMASGVYPWMVVVILARELFVTSIRGVAESQGIAFGAKTSGKLKMILQSIAIPLVLLLVVNWPNPAARSDLLVLQWADVVDHRHYNLVRSSISDRNPITFTSNEDQ